MTYSVLGLRRDGLRSSARSRSTSHRACPPGVRQSGSIWPALIQRCRLRTPTLSIRAASGVVTYSGGLGSGGSDDTAQTVVAFGWIWRAIDAFGSEWLGSWLHMSDDEINNGSVPLSGEAQRPRRKEQAMRTAEHDAEHETAGRPA